MMPSRPIISIIVPVYNKAYALSHTLDSIKNQSIKSYEVILIDDGSTDGSSDICTYYQNNDHRFVYVRQPNLGVSSARNKGISMAGGEFLFFCDADDELPKDSLEKLLEAAEQLDVDLVIGGFAVKNIKTGNIGYPYDNAKERKCSCVSLCENTDEIWKSNNMLSACVKLFRACIIKEFGLRFDEKLIVLEDFDFVLSYMDHSKSIVSISNVAYYQLLGYGVDSYRSRVDYMDDVEYVYNKYIAFLRKYNKKVSPVYMNDIYLVVTEDLKAISKMMGNGDMSKIECSYRADQLMNMKSVKTVCGTDAFDSKTSNMIRKYGFKKWLMGIAGNLERMETDYEYIRNRKGKIFSFLWRIKKKCVLWAKGKYI